MGVAGGYDIGAAFGERRRGSFLLILAVPSKVVSGTKNLPFHGGYRGRPELLTLALAFW